jgi:hypothetical protein
VGDNFQRQRIPSRSNDIINAHTLPQIWCVSRQPTRGFGLIRLFRTTVGSEHKAKSMNALLNNSRCHAETHHQRSDEVVPKTNVNSFHQELQNTSTAWNSFNIACLKAMWSLCCWQVGTQVYTLLKNWPVLALSISPCAMGYLGHTLRTRFTKYYVGANSDVKSFYDERSKSRAKNYLLVVVIQHNSSGLISIISLRLYKTLRRTRIQASPTAVFQRSASTSFFFTVERHLASRSYLNCQDKFRGHLPILLCQRNRQHLVWFVGVTQKPFTGLHQASLRAVAISSSS